MCKKNRFFDHRLIDQTWLKFPKIEKNRFLKFRFDQGSINREKINSIISTYDFKSTKEMRIKTFFFFFNSMSLKKEYTYLFFHILSNFETLIILIILPSWGWMEGMYN